MDTTLSNYRPFMLLFSLTILTSSIVYIEPAPYDLLFFILLLIAILSNQLTYISIQFWPIVLLFLFLMTNIFSLFFIQEASIAGNYLVITIYLIVAWIGLVGILSYFGKDMLKIIFNMYVGAALIVAIPGIIAYFTQTEALELFMWSSDRVKGLFKDPNVFGPFLVPPAIYALWKVGQSKQSKKKLLGWLLVFFIMTLGVLLSFSRAAWGNLVLSLVIYLFLINDRSTQRLKTLFILISLLLPALFYIITKTDVGDLFFQRTGLQGYDDDRFGQQATSLQYVNEYPFGFGPGQSEVMLSQSTHNLFIRLLSENGLLGLVFFIIFFVATVVRSVYMAMKTEQKYKGFFVIIVVSLIGIAFNSLFVDTMHWRHLWLLLALPWMNIRKPTPSPEPEKVKGYL